MIYYTEFTNTYWYATLILTTVEERHSDAAEVGSFTVN